MVSGIMTAIGIDLGGTKAETQVFDDAWNVIARTRVATPDDYDALVQVMSDQIQWAKERAGDFAPIGIGAAGLIHPTTGHALAANLPITGRPFPANITTASGHEITYLNDTRALALSEAHFGIGQGHHSVVALILGTGVGGGIAVNGKLLNGPTLTGGEFGHASASAHLIAAHNLPIYSCGCGRLGCIETYISGPGLQRLAKHITGADLTPPNIAAQRDGAMRDVWRIWCDLTADLIHTLTLTIDPDIIILGGGLSKIDGVIDNLTLAAQRAQFADFTTPPLALAQGGDASGARGAALAAWQAHTND